MKNAWRKLSRKRAREMPICSGFDGRAGGLEQFFEFREGNELFLQAVLEFRPGGLQARQLFANDFLIIGFGGDFFCGDAR